MSMSGFTTTNLREAFTQRNVKLQMTKSSNSHCQLLVFDFREEKEDRCDFYIFEPMVMAVVKIKDRVQRVVKSNA